MCPYWQSTHTSAILSNLIALLTSGPEGLGKRMITNAPRCPRIRLLAITHSAYSLVPCSYVVVARGHYGWFAELDWAAVRLIVTRPEKVVLTAPPSEQTTNCQRIEISNSRRIQHMTVCNAVRDTHAPRKLHVEYLRVQLAAWQQMKSHITNYTREKARFVRQ